MGEKTGCLGCFAVGVLLLMAVAGSVDGTLATPEAELFVAEGAVGLRFVRDPTARDLIYRIERSESLAEWRVLAEAVGGAPTRKRAAFAADLSLRETTRADGLIAVEMTLADAREGTFLRLVTIPFDVIDAATLPLLPPGTHHGWQVSFEALPEATATVVDELTSAAIAQGMSVGRGGADWRDVETAPGVYDLEAFRESLADTVDHELFAFAWLPVIDSEGLVVPDHFAGDDAGFRPGLSFAAPEVRAAFRALLDEIVPLAVAHDCFVLALGNEPDGWLEDNDRDVAGLVGFLEEMRAHAHTLDPRLAITLTLTGQSLLDDRPFARALAGAMDVVALNYYPLRPDLSLATPLDETVPAAFTAFLANTLGKPLIFQELGCPTGWTERPSAIGVTAADAVTFFTLAYSRMAREPRIRASFVFQLVDWSPELTEQIYGPARDRGALDPVTADRLFEWLETTGLITYGNGALKPVWPVVFHALGE